MNKLIFNLKKLRFNLFLVAITIFVLINTSLNEISANDTFYNSNIQKTNFLNDNDKKYDLSDSEIDITSDVEVNEVAITTKINVGKIYSSSTQLPYQFYEIGYCKRENTNTEYKRETIGELFTGDFYAESPFKAERSDKPIKACQMKLTYHDIFFLQYCIDKQYSISMFLDKLPIGLKIEKNPNPSYKTGIPIGFKKTNGKYYLYNFFKFTILFNLDKSIIGLENYNAKLVGGNVYPTGLNDISDNESNYIELKSLDSYNVFRDDTHLNNDNNTNSKDGEKYIMEFGLYYSVVHHKSTIKYSSRWDFLIHSNEDSIHWKQIILSSSLILAAFLWVLVVFLRSVNNDITNYNSQIISGELNPVDKGWKQLSYDVFRQPTNRIMFCAFIGSGVQVRIISNMLLIYLFN